MEEWVNLEHKGFPQYSISSYGRVMNERTERILVQTPNQSGVYKVGMISPRHGGQITVAVAPLVARLFLPIEDHLRDRFNTPINVNGFRYDNRCENLMWRPRWFAMKYHAQFHNDRRGFVCPIRDLANGEVFPTSWEAAVRYGLLDREIYHAINNRTYLFPTGHIFELFQE